MTVLVEKGSLSVECQNDSEVVLDCEHWAGLCLDVLKGEGVTQGLLNLVFTTPENIEELNVKHMDKSGPTDVLTFPMDSLDSNIPNDVPVLLGDIVICPQVALEQSKQHLCSFEQEVTLLSIHGVLHMLGHDHLEDDDKAAMQARELVHMEKFGFEYEGWK